MKRVAVNGMGRIGRLVVRSLIGCEDVELVAVNDIASMETIAYLLAHSTEYGALGMSVSFDEDMGILHVGDKVVKAFREPDALKLPWDELGIDLVLECSGAYCSRAKAQAHIDAGAKKVLVSAAAGSDVPTVVYGINDSILTDADDIVSGASCSTVGLAPFAKALNEVAPIRQGIATTIHALTPSQMTLDDAQRKGNLRRSRTASENIIPTTAAFAQAVGLVLPELQGRLSGYAIRIPVTRGSLITLYAVVSYSGEEALDVDRLNELMHDQESWMFGYTDEELVSSDIAGTDLYSIFDATQTKVSPLDDGYLVEVAAWFDNETSYVSQFVKLLRSL